MDTRENLGEHQRLEELMVGISTSFINIPYGEIDNRINQTLKTTGSFFNADRSYIIMLRQFEPSRLDNTHEWCRDEVISVMKETQNLPVENFRWWFDQMEKGNPIIISSVEKMPDSAKNEKLVFQQQGIHSMAATPMLVDGQLIGFLGFDVVGEERDWEENTITLMEIVANILANTLDRQRSETALRLSQQHQYKLNEIIKTGIEKKSFFQSMRTLSRHICSLIKCNDGFIFYKKNSQQICYKNGKKFKLEESFLHASNFLLQKTRKGVFVCQPDNKIHKDFFLDLESIGESFIVIPLAVDKEHIGLAILAFHDSHHFTPLEIAVCEQAAPQITLMLLKSLALEESEQFSQELDALRATIADITSELEISKLLDTILERAIRLLNADGGDFCVYDPDEENLQVVASRNISEDYNGSIIQIGHGAAGLAAQNRETIVLDDYSEWKDKLEKYDDSGIHAAMVSPMIVADRLIGTIGIFQDDPKNRFNEDNRKMLGMFAQHAAIAMDNAMLFEKVQRMARTDTITGLLNRRALLEMGELEVQRSRRLNHPISVLMVDLDDFKGINDQYSHMAGDITLREIAAVMKKNLRTIDVIGRYGGDEFIIILPETDSSNAKITCERLLNQIRATEIPVNEDTISITASIGYSSYLEEFPEVAVMMNQADLAMYEAKNSGKNTIARYG
jgi:diguanylate cyclase (GGDEF)-like protein